MYSRPGDIGDSDTIDPDSSEDYMQDLYNYICLHGQIPSECAAHIMEVIFLGHVSINFILQYFCLSDVSSC